MNDDLLSYYNAELTYIREIGAEFAEKYPKVATRLRLQADKCDDPHVERLLEGFAFLTARVRQKIDDEFPEITDSLISIVYPHFQRPLPSMSIAQFQLVPEQAESKAGFLLERGTRLSSRPVGGISCKFQTTYPVTLWPVEVESARLDPERVILPNKPPEAVALLQLTLKCVGGGLTFSAIGLDRLRFHLDGTGPNRYVLYELLFNNVCQVQVRGKRADGRTEIVSLPKGAIEPVGFSKDEGMFPYPDHSFVGYRLIQEYFAFPEKFLFFDVVGLERMAGKGLGESIDLLFFLDRPPRQDVPVQAETFRLGCSPIVNLFSKVAEPISLSQTQSEYRVVPDVHHQLATEVYSIESVTSTSAYLGEPIRFAPFYSVRHAVETPKGRPSWYTTRRPSEKPDDPGTEVSLSFVDSDFRPKMPANQTLTIHTTCTNRDLPSRLPIGGDQGRFDVESQAPVGPARCLRLPTRPLRPPSHRGAQWRLISQLSLNHLSIADSEQGLDALRETLKIYDYADSAVTRQQIEGITRVSSTRKAGRTGRRIGNVVCLGVETEVEFDESNFVGGSVFLLASVLERFLGLYVSINSFSQLVAKTRQREGILRRWPPRAGERTLL